MYKEDIQSNDLQSIITQAIDDMKVEYGTHFDPDHINLAELGRRTGITRGRLRTIQKNGFKVLPHGNSGRKSAHTVLTGFTGVLDNLLQNNVTNSVLCFERLQEQGYKGSLSTVKAYLKTHHHLVPVKRQVVVPQGSRGQRYKTDPGEVFQMDWGFITCDDGSGTVSRIACFAMVCHHCGEFYIEFFPNARQENLFIGMIHAFMEMGVPRYILTDNMKSVVTRRDESSRPLWHPDYKAFMETIGFNTKLCKPRHPFTKGAVERLVRYVKGNFIPGRIFRDITDFNYEARRWCESHNQSYHKTIDGIPHDLHSRACEIECRSLEMTKELERYLCPERSISFDGFVSYEGRRFGVPYKYTDRSCRVKREDYTLYIYSTDLSRELTRHAVTWSRKDSFCEGQYAADSPEEFPTAPVTSRVRKKEEPIPFEDFKRFNFDMEVC